MNINRIIREKNLVIPLLGAPGTILSKTTLRENLTNSEVQYKTLSMLIDKFNPDGIFPMMDLTVEIEALGSETNFPEHANPSAVILSAKKYKEFSLYPFKRLISNLNNRPLILHICGNTNHLIKSMLDSGAVGLSLDSGINFEELKKIIPQEITLMGNLNPVKIFLQSTSDQVAEATKSLKESMKDTKNFILSSGCDLPLNTPLENIEAFMKAARGKIN
jgi:uroporphyrinogen decarboxylase